MSVKIFTGTTTAIALGILSAVVGCGSEVPASDTQTLETASSTQSLTAFGVTDAMDIATSGLGFSYWWGGGCWRTGGAKGSCTGSCPSCTHGGTWGADCSGYVAKAWQVPSASETDVCRHPYSTDDFYNTEKYWKSISRGSAKRGDAFVYRKDGAGHIFLFGSGDAWGWIKAYEAKGCSYGILQDSRTASSDYKVIRRNGF